MVTRIEQALEQNEEMIAAQFALRIQCDYAQWIKIRRIISLPLYSINWVLFCLAQVYNALKDDVTYHSALQGSSLYDAQPQYSV